MPGLKNIFTHCETIYFSIAFEMWRPVFLQCPNYRERTVSGWSGTTCFSSFVLCLYSHGTTQHRQGNAPRQNIAHETRNYYMDPLRGCSKDPAVVSGKESSLNQWRKLSGAPQWSEAYASSRCTVNLLKTSLGSSGLENQNSFPGAYSIDFHQYT